MASLNLSYKWTQKKTEGSNFNTDNYTNRCWLHDYMLDLKCHTSV